MIKTNFPILAIRGQKSIEVELTFSTRQMQTRRQNFGDKQTAENNTSRFLALSR